MGAGQSRNGAATSPEEVKISYYELLGVERQATDDDIKRAYRRKALELHPDRNYGKAEEATKTFAEVQAAYEVLSDAQERAWYDSHEGTILRGGDPDDDTQYEANIRVTTTDDIARMMKKFNRNIDFSDKPTGFFGFLREFFEQLVLEEEAAARMQGQDATDYPQFGHKDDRHEDVVKEFYAGWSNFYTLKTFSWKDKWQPSMGKDRYERRYIEKENKKLREEAVKEFNEAVRTLVAFVRKRDPRYQPVVQSDAERQKALRLATAEQAARARAENQAKLDAEDAVPEWARVQVPDEFEEVEEDDEVIEEFECVACRKTFRSEKQFEAHEKSKKHQKSLQALRRQMRKEDVSLNLGDAPGSGAITPLSDPNGKEEAEHDEALVDATVDKPPNITASTADLHIHDETASSENEASEEEDGDGDASRGDVLTRPTSSGHQSELESDTDIDSQDDEYASREAIERRLAGDVENDAKNDQSTFALVAPKIGKAAQKRAKKAAKAAEGAQATKDFRCQRCNAEFPSNTRLFQHIEKEGHAALKSAGGASGKSRTKGKR